MKDLIYPGQPFEALGAMANPNMELGPDGQPRAKIRSAEDLVGPGDKSIKPAPESVRADDPTVERRIRRAQQGVGKLSTGERLQAFWHKMRRQFGRGSLEFLPRTEEFGEARSAAQAWRRAPDNAINKAEELLARTVKGLTENDYQLFSRSVLMRDLTATEGALPFGFTTDTAKSYREKLDVEVEKNAKVRAALEFRKNWWNAVREDAIDAYGAVGVDMRERLNREDYFRHQVLVYMQAKERIKAGLEYKGPISKAKVPLNRGYLKAREGSTLDINANYLEAEMEVATQMIADTERLRALRRIQKQYDIREKLKNEAKAAGLPPSDWERFVPDTHELYEIRPGKALYEAWALPERLAQNVLDAMGQEIGIKSEDMRRAGGRPGYLRPCPPAGRRPYSPSG